MFKLQYLSNYVKLFLVHETGTRLRVMDYPTSIRVPDLLVHWLVMYIDRYMHIV
jgi:hypothetical protein